MKKLFALLALISLFALYGCAEEEAAPMPLLAPDINAPDTLVGSYEIDYFSIQDGSNSTILSDNCTQALTSAPIYNGKVNTCDQVLDITSQRIGIQKHWDVYRYVYSVVIQTQLYSDGIITNKNGFKEHAYHHLIFPIQESYFPDKFGVDAISKATDRGLTSYFIERPYGNFENSNSYVNYVGVEDGKLVIVLKTDDNQKTYIFKLNKLSNDSGNYVYLLNVEGPQGGLRADSIIKNSLMVTNFGSDNGTLSSYFNEQFAIFE